ncbi:hypothetical protein Tco_1394308 [Tanacetum coccineum]
MRNIRKNQQHCLFACFLSQEEPKKIFDALQDDSWVQAMQEELLQFKLQQVWVLVDLPQGMKTGGGFIDYDVVFAHVAKEWPFCMALYMEGFMTHNSGFVDTDNLERFIGGQSFYMDCIKLLELVENCINPNGDKGHCKKMREDVDVDVTLIQIQSLPRFTSQCCEEELFKFLNGNQFGLMVSSESPLTWKLSLIVIMEVADL